LRFISFGFGGRPAVIAYFLPKCPILQFRDDARLLGELGLSK
jgi:hypothetical protein